MNMDTASKPARPVRSWVPYLVLVFSLMLTAGISVWAAAAAENRDQLRFEIAAQRVNNAIKSRMDTYIALLLSGKALFAASGDVTREEFRRYVEYLDIQHYYPGVQGIGFSIYIRPDERDALVARMQAEGVVDFSLRSAGPRDDTTAIIYLEPLDRRNKAAIGYDMFSEPVRRAAMERARDAAIPAASGPVTLVQEIDAQKQVGFLIYVPVYREGMPHSTPEERRAALHGYVHSPFRIDDLFRGILGADSMRALDVSVHDGAQATPESLLYASGGLSGGRRRSVSTLDIAGRPWTVAVSARSNFDALSARGAVPLLSLGGLAVCLLLFGVTRSQARAQLAAERAAAGLSQSERSLRQSEQHLRRVLDGISAFVGMMRPDGVLLEANQAILGAASLKPEDALGQPFEGSYWWSYADSVREEVRAAIARAAKGEVVRRDVRMRVAEDRFVAVELTISPLHGAGDRIEHLVLTCMDISDRLKAEQDRAKLDEEIIRMQAGRLAELSTPLIPLNDRILLMPLIGTVDAQRAQQVLEAVAIRVSSRRARTAIIDITGVSTVDTQVAGLLVQTAQVVRLLGAEMILTGVGPAVAQTIVRIGIDLSGVITQGDLQSGIRYAMRQHAAVRES